MPSNAAPTPTTQREPSRALRLRWLLAHEPASTFEAAARRFGQLVEERAPGAVAVEVLSSAACNGGRPLSPDEAIAKVVSGEVQMCQTYTTALARLHEPLRVLELPYLFRSHEHAARVLDGEIGRTLAEGLRGRGLRGLGFTYSGGYRILTSSSREVREPADLRGLRVRTAESPVAAALFESWGAVAVPAPLHRTVELAREGRIDAAETTYPRFQDQRQAQVHPVVNETHHSLLLTMMVVNEAFFQGLPAQARAAVVEAAGEAARLERATSISEGVQVRALCPSRGVRVVELGDGERARLQSASAAVYARFEPALGRTLVDGIRGMA